MMAMKAHFHGSSEDDGKRQYPQPPDPQKNPLRESLPRIIRLTTRVSIYGLVWFIRMPPKRKQPAASTSAAKPTQKRRSKLAKENDITADEEAEIQDAFELFAARNKGQETKESVIAAKDVRRCLIALNIPPTDPAEMQEILDTVDAEGTGWVSYEHFVAVAALKLHAKHEDPDAMNQEVVAAYKLFTKGQEREINLNDLRRVAKDLREDVPENVLKDMIREATGGGLGGVSMEDFEGVMRRAGVFG